MYLDNVCTVDWPFLSVSILESGFYRLNKALVGECCLYNDCQLYTEMVRPVRGIHPEFPTLRVSILRKGTDTEQHTER